MLGFLGTVLDDGFSQRRHAKWRPNVNVHRVMAFDRVELFISPKYLALAEQVVADIKEIRQKSRSIWWIYPLTIRGILAKCMKN